jgi:hypothetical protein
MLAPHAHLGEISRMHRLLAARLELDEADQARQTAYRATLAGRMEVTERAA